MIFVLIKSALDIVSNLFVYSMIRNFNLVFSALIMLFAFVAPFDTSYIPGGESSRNDLQLSLLSSCENTSTLVWTSQRDGRRLKMCELTYYRTGQRNAEIIDIFPYSESHHIQLSNLHNGKSYTAFLVCDGTRRTNDVNFIVGEFCDLNNSYNTNQSSVNDNGTVQISKTFSFDTVGWLSAVLFSCLGVILVFVVVYYSWKKYQHRQRILRIFRHEQNDPFQAFYSPSQDSYSF